MAKDWPYFLPAEVLVHNSPSDIWISFLYQVFDLTPLVKRYRGQRVVKPLLAYAGKDVSHWFDRRAQDMKHMVHPVTGAVVPYAPHGPLPDIHPVVGTSEWRPIPGDLPWWLDRGRYMVGRLTRRARPLRVVNNLVPDSHRNNLIWVCSEETLNQILLRVEPHNSRGISYVFKCEGRVLDMCKTLEENDLPDQRDRWNEIGMTEDNYVPAIHLYFKDDLTVP